MEAIYYFCPQKYNHDMKKIYLLILIAVTACVFMQSCDNSKTYAELKDDEKKAIKAFIEENDITVISEETFYAQDTMTYDNEYVLFEESGVYMHIVQKGLGDAPLEDGNYEMLSRFIEIAIQDREDDGLFSKGDTILANMKILNATYLTQPEEYTVTIYEGYYYGTFSGYSLMYTYYSSTSVPTGWLIPLMVLKPKRTQSSTEVARVQLIVPHSEGSYYASSYVYPCYYEITYNLGK